MLLPLLYALIVAAVLQPNAPRFFAAVLFMSIAMVHELFLSNLTGLQYYGSSALFDLLIIVLTSGITPVPKMVLSIHKICIASMLINAMGWALWLLYFPPLAYNVAFLCLSAWTLAVFTKEDKADVGGYAMDSWASCFCFSRAARTRYFNKHGGKV